MKSFKLVRKRLLSLFLTLIMIIGCIPFNAESVKAGTKGNANNIERVELSSSGGGYARNMHIEQRYDDMIITGDWNSFSSDTCYLVYNIVEERKCNINLTDDSGRILRYECNIKYDTPTNDFYKLEIDGKYYSELYLYSDDLTQDYGIKWILIPISDTHSYNFDEEVLPTCTTAGYEQYVCSYCRKMKKIEMDSATGHSYTTQVIAPNCTVQGYTKHTCSKCGDTYNDTFIPAKGHSYGPTPTFNFSEDGKGCTAVYRCKNCSATTDVSCVVTDSMKVESTCTKKGITTYTAVVTHPQTGKKSYGTKDVADINKLPHTPTQTKTYLKSNATCTEDAVYYEECSECHSQLDTYWTVEGTALGHDYESTPRFDFSDDGKSCTATYQCKNCTDTIDDYCIITSSTKVEPTCTEKGTTTYTATTKHPQTREESRVTKDVADINALGHSFTETVIPPTLTTEGYTHKVCTVCGHEENTDYVDKVTLSGTGSSPTFDSDLVTTSKEADNYIVKLQDVYVTITGADGKEYWIPIWDLASSTDLIKDGKITIVQIKASDTGTIEDRQECDISDFEDGIPIDDAGMSFEFELTDGTKVTSSVFEKANKDMSVENITVDNGTMTVEEDGSFSIEFSCDTDLSKVTKDDLGVSGADGITAKSLNKETEDKWVLTVSAEDDAYTKEYTVHVHKKEHQYKDTVTRPTCTTDGCTVHTCENCGDTYSSDETKALGHLESDWIIDKPASMTEAGSKHKECTRCGVVIEQSNIPTVISNTNSSFTGADVGVTNEELINAVLTPEEQEIVKAGEEVDITVNVSKGEANCSMLPEGYVQGTAFATGVTKNVGSSITEDADNFNSAIPISVQMPDELINTNPDTQREYKVFCIDKNGNQTEVGYSYDATTGKITYDCKGSGTYVVCYKDTVTSDTNQEPTPSEGTATSKLTTGKVYTVGSLKYKVVSNKTGKETVSVVGAKSKKITKVTVKDTVKIKNTKCKVVGVDNNAFKSNKKLKTVTLGNNISSIGKSAFTGCTSLTKVTVGKGVSSIGSKAFYGCKKLKTVSIKSTKLKKVGKYALKGTYSKMTIKVPSKKVNAYKKIFKSSTGYKKTMKIAK